jgi:hypothetical protein
MTAEIADQRGLGEVRSQQKGLFFFSRNITYEKLFKAVL